MFQELNLQEILKIVTNLMYTPRAFFLYF